MAFHLFSNGIAKPRIAGFAAKALMLGVSALSLAVTMPASAQAADADPVYVDNFGGTPVEFGSGWYLRGDISTFHASGSTNNGPDLTNVTFGEDLSFGGGFGYAFSDNARLGFNISHFGGLAVDGQQGDLSATLFQVEAFHNFGDSSGFSPYVGAGLGIGNVLWENPPANGHDRTSLVAASLMVGLDYRLSEHWIADMGYRFSMLSDFSFNDSTDTYVDEMSIHELRIGLRYEIW